MAIYDNPFSIQVNAGFPVTKTKIIFISPTIIIINGVINSGDNHLARFVNETGFVIDTHSRQPFRKV